MTQDEIVKKYPGLFDKDFVIECGAGWNLIVDELCGKISEYLKSQRWQLRKYFRVEQVKEKYGGLRFYVNVYMDDVENLIREYEMKSFAVCEVCGQPGELRDDRHWLVTLCDSCHEGYQ